MLFPNREALVNITPAVGARSVPVWNDAKCIKCGICYVFCPEGCVQQAEDGLFKANLDYCKGCGICAHECWPRAITMVEEG